MVEWNYMSIINKQCLFILFLLIIGSLVALPSTFAQENVEATPTEAVPVPDTYYVARVVEIMKEGARDLSGSPFYSQQLRVQILKGPDKGKELTTGEYTYTQSQQKLKVGERVVLTATQGPDTTTYYISDRYRIPSTIAIFGIFFLLAVFFARWKGFMSIIGLAVSIILLMWFMVPHILAGSNPLLISLITAIAIALISLYLAHGFSVRTTIAVISTIVTLGISVLLAVLFVQLAKLTGAGTEEAAFLQFGPTDMLNLRGLLLGGIIIGVLGVLDDVTTSQVATVGEIQAADPTLSFSELYRRGLIVGREHIASLVNTLALAYAGASLPLFLLFTINKTQPFWVAFNSEFVIEEVIRTLVGSSSLILAVPIATFLAAKFLGKYEKRAMPHDPMKSS